MRKTATQSGFTIIELLVVIALILVASSLIFIGGGGGDGAALTASQRIVSGVAKGARSQAILKNAKARLIIHNDPSEPEKYLRLFGIIYESTDPATAGQWIAGTQGTLLPEGIYFDPERSQNALSSSWSDARRTQIEFPRAVPKPLNSGTEFYHYEFNSNGTMASNFSNSVLAIRAGTLKPEGDSYTIDFTEEAKESLISALIFRRIGTSTLVTDPAAIVD